MEDSGSGGGSDGKARRSLELQEQQAELERAADCGDVEAIRTLAAAGADLDGTGALGLTALVCPLLSSVGLVLLPSHQLCPLPLNRCLVISAALKP